MVPHRTGKVGRHAREAFLNVVPSHEQVEQPPFGGSSAVAADSRAPSSCRGLVGRAVDSGGVEALGRVWLEFGARIAGAGAVGPAGLGFGGAGTREK